MSLVLLERIRNGDEGAVQELANEHGPSIRRVALRHLRSHEDADEVVQDVLWTVVRKAGSFRGDARLSTWIHTVAFNATMNRLRRSLRRRDIDTEVTALENNRRREASDNTPHSESRIYRQQLRRRILHALRTLPPAYRAAVLLRDVQGLTTCEAGERLQVSSATLKSRLHRGRVMLRKSLRDHAPLPPGRRSTNARVASVLTSGTGRGRGALHNAENRFTDTVHSRL